MTKNKTLLFFSLLTLVLYFPFTNHVAFPAEEIIRISPIKAVRDVKHLVSDFLIDDVNSDGENELILVETGYTFPIMPILTVSKITNGGRKVLWESEQLWFARNLMVGDIDNDSEKEIVLFGPRLPKYTNKEETLLVFKWDGGKFRRQSFPLSGRVGLIADVNNDGKNELVIGQVGWLSHGEGLDPINLNIYLWDGEAFELVSQISSPYAISNIDFGDINNDGINEIVIEENSREGNVKSQITSYQFDTTSKEFNTVFSQNKITNLKINSIKVLSIKSKNFLWLTFRNISPSKIFAFSEKDKTLNPREDIALLKNAFIANKFQIIKNEKTSIEKIVELKNGNLEITSINNGGR